MGGRRLEIVPAIDAREGWASKEGREGEGEGAGIDIAVSTAYHYYFLFFYYYYRIPKTAT